MRLIDADELKTAFPACDNSKPVLVACVRATINHMPTIEPSAQPMRKRGKWIDMGDFEQCSACTGTHLKEVNTVYGKVIWIKSPFCPNCGCDMREEVEE